MLLIIQLVACAWMTGLIWVIQVVHYPMFAAIADDHFQDWMNRHTKTITPIVGLPMLLEVGSGLALLYWPSFKLPEFWAFVNIGLIAVSFIATAMFSIPAHRQLALNGKDHKVIQQLVSFKLDSDRCLDSPVDFFTVLCFMKTPFIYLPISNFSNSFRMLFIRKFFEA